MRLILRPLMPPRSLIELMYAIRPFPVLLSGDAGPLNGNVAPTFTSALVTPGVSARACAPIIVAPITAASMDFLNIDISFVRRRFASLITASATGSWCGFAPFLAVHHSARGCRLGRLPGRPFDRQLPQLVFEYLASRG